MARLVVVTACVLSACVLPGSGQIRVSRASEPSEPAPAACFGQSAFRDVWIKVAERTCVKCHNAEGDASDSQFVLRDAARVPAAERNAANSENCAAFTRMALATDDGQSRLLAKASGGLDHGGGEVLKPGSTGRRILENYVKSVREKPTKPVPAEALRDEGAPFFDGVRMISDQRLLRRATLSLAGRLPTAKERDAVAAGGLNSFDSILVGLMTEEAFETRLLEGFNDILLTLGYDGNGEDVLSYHHFEKTRHWYQRFNLDHIPEKDRVKAGYKLADQYREAMRSEPLELIRYIVQNDRPFGEVLTADYTMMSPYTARGYGQYDELKGRFRDPEDPFEFIPAKVKALKGRDGKEQPTKEGLYPHAGLLTSFQYLRRYPTTETNRNRARARMYYQHFLGVDIMNLAPRVSDAAAIDAKYKVPTMEAAECVVCHKVIDPIAGLFQDYYNEEGHYGPRKGGWFKDMFQPGREGTDMPEDEHWRSLQWLGERTVKDPRFATTMAEHVYSILTGRKVLIAPDDIDDPHFAARRRAYQSQRETIERAAARFTAANQNLKVLFQELVVSDWYRADGLATAEKDPGRRAELDDLGVVRLLGPEQIERKIAALFGKPWGRLNESYKILYGGIDSKEVTERLTEPSGAIGAIQRIMANEVACKNVSVDFTLPAKDRRLFPGIELDVVPVAVVGDNEKRIRAAIVHLHQHILGRDDAPDSPDVNETYDLFAGILEDAAANGKYEKVESYFCKSQGQEGPRDPDPHYTMRAWRGVVTFLLRQRDFLYE